jgi:formylglycine-generating enzyme required for sulfatase activity
MGLLALGLAACGGETPARDQWLVVVDSDAPVPVVGDRLLVEILDQQGRPACNACRRQFGLDEVEPWPVSFGIAADSSAPLLVRARLYRAVNTGGDGLPLPGPILDAAARLPHTEGVTSARLDLHMACLGRPVDLPQGTSCGGNDGVTRAIKVAPADIGDHLGLWALARKAPCEGDAPEGSECVPGGAFLRGDARALALASLTQAAPEELTVLSPFYFDQDEFSVGRYRSLRLLDPTLPEPLTAGASAGLDQDLPAPFIPGTDQPSTFCTYLGLDQSQNDALPLNCVTRALAEALCEARGMRLPSEAEWEFAAGNRDLETRYPWGNDTADLCLRTVYGLSYEALGVGSSNCRLLRPADDQQPGVRVGGDGDVTLSGIRNLAGNLAEWISDSLVTYADPCWPREPWLRDPRCDDSGSTFAIRGGNWRDGPHMLESTSRNGSGDRADIAVGFRCAADASSK